MSSIATIAVGFAPCAFALSCPAYRSAVDIAETVDLVLVGRVIRREHGFHEGDGPAMMWIKNKFGMTVRRDFMGVKWEVEPVELLKGRLPKSLVVWSPDAPAQAEINVGTTPILYLYLWHGDYLADYCRQNYVLANDSSALELLRRRYSRDAKER